MTVKPEPKPLSKRVKLAPEPARHDNGACQLHFAGNKKLETTANGVSVVTDSASAYGFDVLNDGNNNNRYGVKIRCGQDTPDQTNIALTMQDGDGTTQGTVSF